MDNDDPVAKEFRRLPDERLRLVAVLAAGRRDRAIAEEDDQRAIIFTAAAEHAAQAYADRMEVAAVRGLIRDAAAALEAAALAEDR